jgi:broad specificity phosphatase PhoE
MILLRHAESEFNVHYSRTRVDPGIRDPEITERGRGQARDAASALNGRSITRIVTSPYIRALQTAEIVADVLHLPVSVNAAVGERCAFTCDLGTAPTELSARWPDFSFHHLEEEWWPTPVESDSVFRWRCERFRSSSAKTEDWPEVLVITHWGFVRGLTGLSITNAETTLFDPNDYPLPTVEDPS